MRGLSFAVVVCVLSVPGAAALPSIAEAIQGEDVRADPCDVLDVLPSSDAGEADDPPSPWILPVGVWYSNGGFYQYNQASGSWERFCGGSGSSSAASADVETPMPDCYPLPAGVAYRDGVVYQFEADGTLCSNLFFHGSWNRL
jgi:hypothetical protein